MASRSGITWDSMVKAGTDMMEIAGASLQRTMKIQEVTGTKDNDSQPGVLRNYGSYALNELVQACNKNSDEARAIAAALLRRASSSNPVIKWKALRAIRYICQHASTAQFKKACGGPNAAVIRESISWSGPPHPQLGNALNLRVREAAKETLDEVFRVSAGSAGGAAAAGGGSGLQGRIQGYGSTTGGKILSSPAGGVSGTATGGFNTGGASSGTGGKKYGGISSDDYFSGGAGGRWQTWSDASQSGPGTNGSASAAPSSSAAAGAGTTASTSAARAAIGSEESVVADLCRGSGGVQPRPTQEALRTFVAKASQLDAEVVALELTHKLFNTPWQERVRALDGMHAAAEAVKARGGGHPLQGAVDSLRSVTEAFGGVLGHENPAVRAAAGRVMRALDVEPPVAAAVLSAQQSAAAAGGDLLGRLDDGDAPATSQAPTTGASAAAPPATQLHDLLGGMDDGGGVGGDGVVQLAQGDVGALGGLDALDDLGGLGMGAPVAPTAAPAPPAGSGVTDMFAGLTVSGGAGTAPAATVEDPLESLIGGWGDAPAPAAGVPEPSRNGTVAAPAALTPGAGIDPLAGLGDLDGLLSGAAAAVAPLPTPAPPAGGAGMQHMPPATMATGANGMHGAHPMPHGGQPGLVPQFGAQPGMVPPGMFGAAPAPGMHYAGPQPGMAYPGAGMQPGYGMQPPAGAWNGQMGMMGGQQMHGVPGSPMPGPSGSGGGGMGLPQGSLGAPVTQHAFAHAAGSLGGHKDAFDFVNDVIKKPNH